MARAYVARGGALVLTSQHWDEIEAICNRITMIDRGETVLTGTLGAIRARMALKPVRFALPRAPPGWLQARAEGPLWSVESRESDALVRRLVAEGLPFTE